METQRGIEPQKRTGLQSAGRPIYNCATRAWYLISGFPNTEHLDYVEPVGIEPTTRTLQRSVAPLEHATPLSGTLESRTGLTMVNSFTARFGVGTGNHTTYPKVAIGL